MELIDVELEEISLEVCDDNVLRLVIQDVSVLLSYQQAKYLSDGLEFPQYVGQFNFAWRKRNLEAARHYIMMKRPTEALSAFLHSNEFRDEELLHYLFIEGKDMLRHFGPLVADRSKTLILRDLSVLLNDPLCVNSRDFYSLALSNADRFCQKMETCFPDNFQPRRYEVSEDWDNSTLETLEPEVEIDLGRTGDVPWLEMKSNRFAAPSAFRTLFQAKIAAVFSGQSWQAEWCKLMDYVSEKALAETVACLNETQRINVNYHASILAEDGAEKLDDFIEDSWDLLLDEDADTSAAGLKDLEEFLWALGESTDRHHMPVMYYKHEVPVCDLDLADFVGST